jgi:hypothetical protein
MMSRNKRIHAIACAITKREFSSLNPAQVECEARDNKMLRELAAIALDIADSTHPLHLKSAETKTLLTRLKTSKL